MKVTVTAQPPVSVGARATRAGSESVVVLKPDANCCALRTGRADYSNSLM
jgi:hypothetical protein